MRARSGALPRRRINEGCRKLVGLSNIELISDRPIETNLAEVADVKLIRRMEPEAGLSLFTPEPA